MLGIGIGIYYMVEGPNKKRITWRGMTSSSTTICMTAYNEKIIQGSLTGRDSLKN